MAGGFPLRINGIRILTSEALYQACRFPHLPDIQRLIISEASPMTAKMRSKPHRKNSRHDWDYVRVKIMRWCLRVKLALNWNKFSDLLLSTGEKSIVEESRKDSFWGAKPTDRFTLVGMNILGRLLMELREKLKTEQINDLLKVPVPDIENFFLYGVPIEPVFSVEYHSLANCKGKTIDKNIKAIPQAIQISMLDQIANSTQTATCERFGETQPIASQQAPTNMRNTSVYHQYKESKVSRIGHIPSHWQENRAKYYFREIDERSKTGTEEMLSVSHVTGVTPRSQKKVTMFQAESNVGHKVCHPGDLVINTMWAWMAAMGVSKHLGLVSPSYSVYQLRDMETFDSYYLDQLSRIEEYRSEYICQSTGIRSSRLRLYPEKFLSMPFIRPPKDEQGKIVNYLKSKELLFRNYIRNKRKLIDLLNEKKQNIINKFVTQGTNPNVKFKSSGLQWLDNIPNHWDLCRLRNIISSVTSGPRGWSSYAADDGPLFLRITNLRRSSLALRFDNTIRLNLPNTSETLRTKVQPGDILLSITAYIGSVAVVPDDIEEAFVSQHVARCSLSNSSHNPYWIGYVLLSDVGQIHGKLSLYGGTKDGLSLLDVKNYPVLLPPRTEQDEIVKRIEEQTSAIEAATCKIEREIELIRQYRSRLISDVVTGKVDVRNIELAPVPEEELLAIEDDVESIDNAEQDDTPEMEE